ncbi:MAG: hypothetical protein Fur0035_12720 [Anaerolineales bacterium]
MNKNEFLAEIKAHSRPVVVDFWEVDADENSLLLQQLGVRGIPTLILFRAGGEVFRATGAMPAASYDQMFADLASGKALRAARLSAFERILRIGAGAALFGYGLPHTNWLMIALSALVALAGVYDLLPRRGVNR